MENTASIPNIAISTSGYRAIFPPSILTNSDANINSSSSVAVTLPTTQVFEMVGTHQRVNVPMGAVLNGGNTLQFRNLCSVVRVYVSNATNAQLPITSIILTAERACLSGAGTAIITGDSTDAIVMPTTTGFHSVHLCKTDNSTMKTTEPLATEYFDVVIPEFSVRNNLTVTVLTPIGAKSITIEDTVVAHNTITTVTVNVDELSQSSAELVDGEKFRNAIPRNATAIRFEYNNASVTSGTILSTDSSPYPIYGYMDGTTWVVSTPANKINANADCKKMFWWSSLTSIDFGDNFNTANVTDMSDMFDHCRLTSLDLSNFNTANVMDMSGMFGGSSLTSLDLSNFNTSNVTDMSGMFGGSSLTSLDLSNFNTANVTDMSGMFGGSSLTSLDLSNFNTENVTSMVYMFDSCINLTSLNLSNFNTTNVKDMYRMFRYCRSLTSLNLSSFNTSNITSMSMMFYGCSSLTSLNLSNFNTENVVSMDEMFYGCSSLTSLNLSNFNTENVESMYRMFSGCSNLSSLDLSSFNTSNVNDMGFMFLDCTRLTSLNLYNFDMGSLTNDHYYYDPYDRYGPWGYHSGKNLMCFNLASESGACTITCPTTVQTELQIGTGLVNNRITWYTH
jgi:surface protein